MSSISNPRKGFTLVELLVSVGIFALMTALIVAKYGNFNNSVLLTNLAYDVALTIRTAQTYGLSVKNLGGGFQNAYGVHFDTSTGKNDTMILFADTNSDKVYTSGTDSDITTYSIKRGATISHLCTSSGPCSGTGVMDITFKRPDPNAVICNSSSCTNAYAQIEVKATDGSTRVVEVRDNGQITVKD